MAKLCAIVLDYRGASKTEACLQSLSGQGLDTVLLVDNSNDKNASAALAKALEHLGAAPTDYSLQVLKPHTNLGFACGVNFAIAHPAAQHCDVFLLLNNDATMAPGALKYMAAALHSGDADLVAPAIIDDQGKAQPQLWYQRFFGLLTARPLPGSYAYLSGCCILFRRSLAPSGKLFDEDFFMYGEDTLLGWRLLREKKRAVVEPDAVVRHTGQGTWPDCSLFYEYQVARAHVLLAGKTWRSPLELPLLFGVKATALLARAVRRSIHYRKLTPLRAFFLAWRPLDIRKNP
ncbi:MAG TPA: glycosyltransferase family 2 protein [Noviherbaspirillum sp.]